jgi:hypothetical protein
LEKVTFSNTAESDNKKAKGLLEGSKCRRIVLIPTKIPTKIRATAVFRFGSCFDIVLIKLDNLQDEYLASRAVLPDLCGFSCGFEARFST